MSIKLNDAEITALRGLSDLQFRVYVAGLRPYMDYVTGIVGGPDRRISYQGIHEDTYVEPTSGAKARRKPSKFQMRRMLKALERAGLIELMSQGRHLILKCLLADTDNSAQNQAATRPQQNHAESRNEKPPETLLKSDDNENRPQLSSAELCAQAATPPVSGKNISSSVVKRERVGTRLPEDWTLPLSWKQWAEDKRPDLNVEEVADIFKDHWLAHAGKEARKRNWFATWRNWVRRERTQVNPHERNHRPYRSAVSEVADSINRARAQRGEVPQSGRIIEGKFS